ncbi:ATP-binding protein [Actinomadura litoris]|uniref:ATP-binding protein n=1 Tax=Actinomadura litoris TaxID=2678616 RepID=A0A7K1LCY0_9ACTN|nr:ATP-binding protein [Actinomadura litoris]MUN42290.1 ATP-binding protein [Actinomadura litoris]
MSAPVKAPEIPTLVLESTDRAAGVARGFVADVFAEWGVADDYVGRLVVCELVTNSYLHGEGPIVVRVLRDERDGRLVIEVWDGGEGRPEVVSENLTATSGRGLALVVEMAWTWGVRPLNEGGKIVWVKLR